MRLFPNLIRPLASTEEVNRLDRRRQEIEDLAEEILFGAPQDFVEEAQQGPQS